MGGTFTRARVTLNSRPVQVYLEDFVPGTVYEFGHAEVTETDIIDFAHRFDPQPMHIDPKAAARGHFGGLMIRLFVEHFPPANASPASPGVDELRWTRPVRPGDVLRLRVTVIEAMRSRSRPDRGMLRTLTEVLNQNGEVVMDLKPVNLLRCRPVSASDASGTQGSAREVAR